MIAFLAVATVVVAVLGIETKQKPLEAIASTAAEDVSAGTLKIA